MRMWAILALVVLCSVVGLFFLKRSVVQRVGDEHLIYEGRLYRENSQCGRYSAVSIVTEPAHESPYHPCVWTEGRRIILMCSELDHQ